MTGERPTRFVVGLLRWLLVLPVSAAVAVLVGFALFFGAPVYTTLGIWGSVISIATGTLPFWMLLSFHASEPVTVVYLAQSLLMPVAAVYTGAMLAPAHRLRTGAVLVSLWLLLTGAGIFGEVYLNIVGNSGGHAPWAVAAAALPAVLGAVAALALVGAHESQRSRRRAALTPAENPATDESERIASWQRARP